MSHHIYQTEAFVIRGSNVGEANRFFFIFTKELGMVMASAQGIRLLKSKLRYSLQDFSRSNVSLVRGKNGWKITSASEIQNFYRIFEEEPQKLQLVVRSFSLLKHLLAGEEKNTELFVLFEGAFQFLKELSLAQLKNFECLFVLRTLANLGYFGQEKFERFVNTSDWSVAFLDELEPLRREALAEINKSLSASSLL